MVNLTHRSVAYGLLSGAGIEVGALHEPAPVPAGCSVDYFDAISEEQAAALFPEIPRERFVKVSTVGDLDRAGLSGYGDGSKDFVIINHVLEHLSNPIKTVQDVFRVVRPGGIVIMAIPDKRYTFDRHRALTAFEHLWSDYKNGTTESDDEHYLDFLRSAAPHVFAEPPENLLHHVARARTRREHTHVWDSDSFLAFLDRVFRELNVQAEQVSVSRGETTQIECFTVWRKRAS